MIGALAAVAIALPAAGQEDLPEDLHPADRVLIHSYSSEAMQLLWATTDETTTEPCEIEEGTVYTFTEEEDGVVVQAADGEVLTDGCAVTATDVQGPNGQVNHGTVVSSFVKALREAAYEGGVGCYVQTIARTDYGKGDQQVRVPDANTASEEVNDPEVEFTITEVDCGGTEPETEATSESPADSGEPAAPRAAGKGKGKPDWAGTPGPPPHAKGRGRR